MTVLAAGGRYPSQGNEQEPSQPAGWRASGGLCPGGLAQAQGFPLEPNNSTLPTDTASAYQVNPHRGLPAMLQGRGGWWDSTLTGL
ncbi:hypothetical protein AAFF_G00062640 [Aldrovandia affinis]|uniref:Uncharacterized protein n=1 Tax=Aldrovandia affinis TaxID=143900 RepID=A0AAD7WDM9_9TELE|nr:hypothetical protein AAFF_G00062640 [Aldrovandia affinis]